ncbi:MAG: sulfatase-like hydrolase/transferase [Haloarculaceae archaeon]
MSTSRPNVVLITADDQRFDTVDAVHDTAIATPNLDRLVESGCAFTRAHNMGSEHGAVCVPARSMIHSGRSLFHLDGPGGMTTEHRTLPEAFGGAGYRTFATGKWHNGPEAFNRCYDEGRDVFFGGMGNHWNVPVTDRHPLDEYPEDRPHRFLPGDGGPRPRRQTYERYSSGTHSSELFADALTEFLDDHNVSSDNRPFFAYAAFMAPHDPRTCPGEYHAMYDPRDVDLPENFAEAHPFDNGYLHTRDEDLASHPRDPDETRRHIADYYAMVTHLDAQVGRVLDALARLGERENTLVVFTADHGLAVGQHGLLGKQNVYDHSVRVPLVFSGPGVPAGERRDAFTYHHDLYPTLADLAGLETPGSVDGESLVPAIVDDADGPRDTVFTAFGDTQRAVRTDRYKLVEYDVGGESHTQLFDVVEDPGETESLADDPEHADTLARLRDDLADWRERVDDPDVPG